jgi:cytochrome b561
MQITNTTHRYGSVAIFLHWIMAILIVGLLVLGIVMTRIPISLFKLKLYGWHKEYGVLVLMLVMLRIVWRIGNKNPSLAELPLWERLAARGVHWGFYFFMLALPLSGWLLTSAAGLPVSFFGLFLLPDLIAANEDKRMLLTEVHKWLAYGLIATFCGHVCAALKHHFINKDDIMRRML